MPHKKSLSIKGLESIISSIEKLRSKATANSDEFNYYSNQIRLYKAGLERAKNYAQEEIEKHEKKYSKEYKKDNGR